MAYVLIIGAKGDIAKSLAEVYAKNNYNLYLAGRNIDEIEEFSNTLKEKNSIEIKLKEFDIVKFNLHEEFYKSLKEKPFGVILVAGFNPEQKEAELNWEISLRSINVNYVGPISILNIAANEMEKNQKGFIVGISSAAGDRGRQKNYIYGSSKAGLSAYLSGLRNRLFKKGVHVLTVKPGFVETKMTKGLNLPKKFTAQPSEVADDIFAAQKNKKDILYTSWIWRYIMIIIKSIPEFIFKKTDI
jgi:hypothetical protein